MNGVYEHLIVGFCILKFFVLTKIYQSTVFEGIHAEVDGPGNLQEYGALKMKKKSLSRGAWKRGDWCKKWMKNQRFASDEPL